jgi:PAS domain-containing protein
MNAPEVKDSVSPTLVIDCTGTVIDCNPAAERCFHVSPGGAVRRPIWELYAGVAPATVPYETALEQSRARYERILSRGLVGERSHEVLFEDILFIDGTVRRARSDLYRVRNNGVMAILSVPRTTTLLDGSP